MKRVLISALVAALLVAGMALEAFAQPEEDAGTPSAEAMLELVNSFRETEGQEALKLDDALCEAAQVRASEMAKEAELSHDRPDGTIFDTSFSASGQKGENVFRGGPLDASEVPERAFLAWKDKSVAHCQNMLDSSWGHMGVGYAFGEDGYWYVCQLFSETPATSDDESGDDPEATQAASSEDEDSEGSQEPDDVDASQKPAKTEAPATSTPSYDPNRILQRIEAPDEVTAGEVITFHLITRGNGELRYYHPVWTRPGKYRTCDVSRDLRTMTLKTTTADRLTVSFRITNGNTTESVSKTVVVRNAVPVELTGPEQTAPGKRSKVVLDAPADISAKDISWTVNPGLCALEFSADKRTCTFVSPTDVNVSFIAKVKLKDSVATAKKSVKVVSDFPVELKAVTKGRVGYELELHAEFDDSIPPRDIYWSMYPGTCDAGFTRDNRTMYFTPTTTDTLTVTVRAVSGSKSGAASLVVPVAPASSPTAAATATRTPVPQTTAAPSPDVSASASSGPTTVSGTLSPASSSSEHKSTSAPADQPTATSEPAVRPLATPDPADQPVATSEPAVRPLATPDSADQPAATSEPAVRPLATPGLANQSTGTSEPVVRPLATPGLAEPAQSAVPTALPEEDTSSPSTSETTSPGNVQHLTSGENVWNPPSEGAAIASEDPYEQAPPSVADPDSDLQLLDSAQISIEKTGIAHEQVAVMEMHAGLAVADILRSFNVPAAHQVAVVDSDGKMVAPDARPATGQNVQMTNSDGEVVKSMPVVVPGDVLGTGKMNISQLVRAARAFTGEEPLTGIYLQAAKMTGPHLDGNVSLADIVRMAHLLTDAS